MRTAIFFVAISTSQVAQALGYHALTRGDLLVTAVFIVIFLAADIIELVHKVNQ